MPRFLTLPPAFGPLCRNEATSESEGQKMMNRTKSRTRALIVVAALGAGLGAAAVGAQRPAVAPAPASGVGGTLQKTVAAANAFLATLDAGQRVKALFPFDSPQKKNWSNLPSGIFQRNSLRVGDMTAAQREATFALLSTVLSRDGYKKVVDIMNGDEVLKNRGGGRTGGRQAAPGAGRPGGRGGGVMFGKDEYYIALLGEPSPTNPWMIQFGGHHLGINVTIVGPQSVITPSLPAAQPATYTLNGETIRPLAGQNDKAFALMATLDAAQRQKVILPFEVRDLVLGPLQDGKVIQPEGMLATELTPAQQTMLLDVTNEWVGMLNDEAAAQRMTEIRANLSKTYFAWSGATTNGGLAYYRIQGPTLVIEYAPQQGDLDHIHTIYRDPTNDYGAKLTGR
jgi:hypothetical protein